MSKEIHFLGPPGTFTEQATKYLGGLLGDDYRPCPRASVEEAIRGVSSDTSGNTLAVVPYYNLLEGLVQESIDLITEHDLQVVAAQQILIRFALGAAPDSNDRQVVYSHPKGLTQCSDYLTENHPSIAKVEVNSTSAAAEKVRESGEGLAIARLEALRENGLEILAEDIGNVQHGRRNYTEFLLVSATPVELGRLTPCFRTMVAIMPLVDRVGLLADILGQIAFFGINLLKIHSRPALADIRSDFDPQMFYLEMASRTDSPEFRHCMDSLNLRLSGTTGKGRCVRILGEYPLFAQATHRKPPL
jgi:prephenate dehydratase